MRNQYKILSEKYQMVKESLEPVMVIDSEGNKRWYLNGVLHRTDGPAVEWTDGAKQWYLNGKYHRTDGPAIEFADGDKAWYLNGEEYIEADWKNRVEFEKGLTDLAKFRVGVK